MFVGRGFPDYVIDDFITQCKGTPQIKIRPTQNISATINYYPNLTRRIQRICAHAMIHFEVPLTLDFIQIPSNKFSNLIPNYANTSQPIIYKRSLRDNMSGLQSVIPTKGFFRGGSKGHMWVKQLNS